MAEVEVTPKELHGAQFHDHFALRPIKRWVSATFFIFIFMLLVGASIFWIDFSSFSSSFSVIIGGARTESIGTSKKPKTRAVFALNCSNQETITKICTSNQLVKPAPGNISAKTCPDYFQWIHEDLRPWKSTGISRDMIERLKVHSHFRMVIVNGTAYYDKFHDAFQTRELFTVWGIVQLLRFYPGKVPDLELMFRCEDRPLIQKRDYQTPNATSPPPLFGYCGHDDNFNLIFPDWSFWGWVETNIKPWSSIVEGIIEGSKKTKWKNRVPYGYWRGNPDVSPNRADLMTCNVSKKHDWGVRLYRQDWRKETDQRFKHSNLEDQCTHRYKIYIEGVGWSVSRKYILACDSMTLLVKPDFYDFFSRGLVPMNHYWPIRKTNKCRDLRFAVDWGNDHPAMAQEIGKAGSGFVNEELAMENVYAYMLHLLIEYAKLLKFKPQIPTGAVELCSESMVCLEKGVTRKFMVDSMVQSPSDTPPCTMPPPYDPPAFEDVLHKNNNISLQVESWADQYWKQTKDKH